MKKKDLKKSDFDGCSVDKTHFCPHFDWPGDYLVCGLSGRRVRCDMNCDDFNSKRKKLFEKCPLPDPKVICKL